MAILDDVRYAAEKRMLFLPHAVRQMSRPQRMISPSEVQMVVTQGELIEVTQTILGAIAVSSWVGVRRTGGPCGLFAEGRVSCRNHGLFTGSNSMGGRF